MTERTAEHCCISSGGLANMGSVERYVNSVPAGKEGGMLQARSGCTLQGGRDGGLDGAACSPWPGGESAELVGSVEAEALHCGIGGGAGESGR